MFLISGLFFCQIPEFHGPNLPPKTVLNNMSEEFLVKRSKALDNYLQVNSILTGPRSDKPCLWGF